jgi:hypothetical protein
MSVRAVGVLAASLTRPMANCYSDFPPTPHFTIKRSFNDAINTTNSHVHTHSPWVTLLVFARVRAMRKSDTTEFFTIALLY